MIETTRYIRKRFYVEVVEVTAENFEELAKWVGGVEQQDHSGIYIEVPVSRPQSERQTRAYIGDFVLKANSGFKVFTSGAFAAGFELAPEPTPEKPTTGGKKRGKPYGRKPAGHMSTQARVNMNLTPLVRGHLSDEDVAASS